MSSSCFQLFFEFSNFFFKIYLFQEVLDSFGTHLGNERSITILTQALTVFALCHDRLVLKWCILRINHHISRKVDNFLEGTGTHIKGQAHTAWNPLEVPDVRYRSFQFDMPHTLTTNFCTRYFNPTTVTNNSSVTNAFVLTTSTFPVFCRTKDDFVKESFTFWFQRTVIDCFRFFDFSIRP